MNPALHAFLCHRGNPLALARQAVQSKLHIPKDIEVAEQREILNRRGRFSVGLFTSTEGM